MNARRITIHVGSLIILTTLGVFTTSAGVWGQAVEQPRVYKGQIPEFAQAAQQAVDTMPVESQPRMEAGRIQFPNKEARLALAQNLAETARQTGSELLATNDSLDLESPLSLGSDHVLLRVVVGRHGRDGSAVGLAPGEDGASVIGIREARPQVMLVVSGGKGGNGSCGGGGKGGQAKAFSTSRGGAVIAIGGIGGDAGINASQGCSDVLMQSEFRKVVSDVDPEIRKLNISQTGPNGPDGGAGGDAQAFTQDCVAGVVAAIAGNGGNGVLPQPSATVFGSGGSGGNGGTGTADCGPSIGFGPCQAEAAGGNAGHGASGANAVATSAAGGGGGGGSPSGGNAIAISCCGTGTMGSAGAVAGSGGHGGNGGNALSGQAGNGGNGSSGGNATAIVELGTTGSVGSAVGGSGGNGGNGGNTTAPGAAGLGGVGGFGGPVSAFNYCPSGTVLFQPGVNGLSGVNGASP